MYFFLWYEDQKELSHYDMNVNYKNLVENPSLSNMDAFREYIMGKDIIILSNKWELSCSESVLKKIQENEDALKELNESLFFKYDNKIYFIFSEYYEDIWEVKVLFDTTEYMKSQIIIIKISLIIIALFGLMSYFIGRTFSKYALQDLKKIAQDAQNMSIDNFTEIKVGWPKYDEIRILADTINASFTKIRCQAGSLKQFITDVSHEFKTPLMIINSKIDLYNKMEEKWKAKDQDKKELLLSIKDNTKKLNKILETLFLLSRKSEGLESFDRENINMTHFIQQYSQDFIKSVDREVELKIVGKKKIMQYIEVSTVSIVLENLLTNAIKFNKSIPVVEVWVEDDYFWVKDSGPWMTQEDLEKIWEKFYRKDINTEGFWVGLFIVKRILDLYGWRAHVESQLWVGTTFKIYFK